MRKKSKKIKHIHFTGIKGVGMTALAIYVKEMGIKVSGSDVREFFVTDETLAKKNIKWNVGFGKQNLKLRPDLLVTTGAHGGLKNHEVLMAKKLGVPITTYAELLAKYAKKKKTIGVCGVGGKSTVASMISVLLDSAGKHPSFVIGVGSISPLETSGRYDKKGKHFICEADDYVVSPGVDNTPKFLLLIPKILVVTNIEHDHPDIYPTFEDTKKAFRKLFNKISKNGVLVACIDNPNVANIVKHAKAKVITYGFHKQADFQIKNIQFKPGETIFNLFIRKNNELIKNIKLSVPGKFNARNATATFIVGKFLDINNDALKTGIAQYQGCRRRFEKMKDE
ncbi:hypothetical protein KKB40_01580, partial [Patescibacteria group bacterium]|nr:hypothetical protein [Patescibacteria group bacterium]